MAPSLHRLRKKLSEVEPLTIRRIRKKESNRLRKRKTGLRRRLKMEDLEEKLETEEDEKEKEENLGIRTGNLLRPSKA